MGLKPSLIWLGVQHQKYSPTYNHREIGRALFYSSTDLPALDEAMPNDIINGLNLFHLIGPIMPVDMYPNGLASAYGHDGEQ